MFILKNPRNQNNINEIGNLVAIVAICKDCKNQFTLDQGKIRWYSMMGFPLPKRCPECLEKRKNQEYKEYRNGILDPRD